MKQLLWASAAIALLAGAAATPSAAAAAPPAKLDTIDVFTQIADEVTDKMLNGPEYQAKIGAGRKPKIVVGDVRNNTDDEDVRVDDIFNEIRNRIVATNTSRLFSAGELNADLVISPELSSITTATAHTRGRHCFTLQLTLSTISGEYVAAYSASRCTS